jgi:cytoskeletal protein RodZ
MRIGQEKIGPRGRTILVIAAVVAVAMGIYGWGRGTIAVGGTLSLSNGQAPTTTSSPTTSSPTTSSPTTSSSTTPRSHPTTSVPTQKVGPLLSSTQYASYAYELYPGPQNSQTKLATAGFKIRITPNQGTVTVSVTSTGSSQAPQVSTIASSDKVYFIEASFGDDSNDSEYNMGDDGLIFTNAAGRIVQ